jgi:hypothetical protein
MVQGRKRLIPLAFAVGLALSPTAFAAGSGAQASSAFRGAVHGGWWGWVLERFGLNVGAGGDSDVEGPDLGLNASPNGKTGSKWESESRTSGADGDPNGGEPTLPAPPVRAASVSEPPSDRH